MIAEISVSAGYPANGLYKLYIRQCKCELELGRSVTTKVVVICSYFSSIVLLAFFLVFFFTCFILSPTALSDTEVENR